MRTEALGRPHRSVPAFDQTPMKVTILAVTLSVLVPRVDAADVVSVTGATVTEVGIYTAQVVKEFSVSSVVGGTNQGLDGFTLVQATTNVPTRTGTRFGFRYTINGSPTNAPIILTMVGEHPPFRDPRTGKTQSRDVYQLESWIERTYTSHSLDEKWELIPGKWKFEVWHNDKKLDAPHSPNCGGVAGTI